MAERTISRANLTTLTGLCCFVAMFIFFYMPHAFGFEQLFISLGSLFFIIGMILDAFDGYFARKDGTAGPLGAALDELKDKIGMTLFYGALMDYQVVSGFCTIMLITREWLVTLLRVQYILSTNDGSSISAGWSGKIKTVCQTVFGILFIAGFINLDKWPPFLEISQIAPYAKNEIWQLTYFILMIILVIISYASAGVYFYKYWEHFYKAITIEKRS